MQVEGLFDIPPAQQAELTWDVNLPLEEQPWHLGLIVGPSGCGKSTVARALFAEPFAALERLPPWPVDGSVLDAFPADMPVKTVVGLLSSVGFSSPPAWLRPFRVLSTGEQFRVTLARLLAEAMAKNEASEVVVQADGGDRAIYHAGSSMGPRPGGRAGILGRSGKSATHPLIVCDEFTSTVDRTVARVGSAALAKTVRTLGCRFVAVTCHEDVEEWLQPDWVYRPATNTFAWRCLRRRPAITLTVYRCRLEAWQLFRPHHYLSMAIHPSAQAFFAVWEDRPVAFSAWVNALICYGGKREHRTVCLPDYQGVGIGHALSSFCASLWVGLGYRALSTTTHPAFIAARLKSPHWRLTRVPALASSADETRRPGMRHADTRLTAGFEYVGPPLDRETALKVLSGTARISHSHATTPFPHAGR
jgi:hypothetical protein